MSEKGGEGAASGRVAQAQYAASGRVAQAQYAAGSAVPQANLTEKYRVELEKTYDTLKCRSVELSESVQQQLTKLNENFQSLQPQLKQQGDEVLQSLQSVQEPLTDVPNKRVLSIFAWAAVMEAGYLAGSIVGAYILFPFVGLFIGGFWASMLTYLLLPGLAVSQLLKADNEGDQSIRHKLLLLALAQGVLTGYLFNSRYLSTMQPIALLTPLLVVVSSQYVIPLLGANPPRIHLLGAMLGTGVVAHLAVGLVLDSLSLSYLVLTLLYAGVAYCTLQLLFKYNYGSEGVEDVDHFYMLAYLVAAVYVQSLVFVLFGGAKPVPAE